MIFSKESIKNCTIQIGDVIEFCDETYIVVMNHGNSGLVKEYYDGKIGDFIGTFYWYFKGSKCVVVDHIELKK